MKRLLLLPLTLLASCVPPALPEEAPQAIVIETKSFDITIGETSSVATLKENAKAVTLCAQGYEYQVCNNTYVAGVPREYSLGSKDHVVFFERELR